MTAMLDYSIFSASPSLPGLSPEEYAKGFERGFDGDYQVDSTDERVRRLLERRTTRPDARVFDGGGADRAFIEEIRAHGVGVAGAGLMGISIAAAFVGAGFRVLAYDPIAAALESAPERLRRELTAQRTRRGEAEADPVAEAEFVAQAVERLYSTTDSLEELATRAAVVESIPEKLKLKAKFYRDLDRAATRDLVVLTNSSSLRVADLAASLSEEPRARVCRGRFAAFHFFHPVAKRNLVEIASGSSTDPETLERAVYLGKAIRKIPIVVHDGPGLLVNRLLQAYLNESLKLLDAGVAPERLEAICLRTGMEGSPLRAIDEIGVDVSMHAGWSFLKAFPERTHNSTVMAGLVREGRLGRKTKLGFYRYASNASWADDAVLDCGPETLERLRAAAPEPGEKTTIPNVEKLSDEELAIMIFDAILDEGKRLIEEKIVGSYREVDAGLTLALGFPEKKGGIFYWALAVGRLER